MKSNAAGILSILNGDSVGFFFVVELGLQETYRYTTLPYDIVWNGNSYVTETNLVSFEPPRATTTVDRQVYKIELSALDDEIRAEVDSGIVNRPVSINMGFVVNGEAILGNNDLIYVYAGTVANVTHTIGGGTQKLMIECSAPLSSLDAKSTLFTTRDGIRSFNITDTSFDQIFEGSSEYSLNWGKKEPAPEVPPIELPWLKKII